jgi:hypothetical protein
MNSKYKVIFILSLFINLATYAQPANPPADGDGVPVDGGITALLIGGAFYGAKKLKERKNQK